MLSIAFALAILACPALAAEPDQDLLEFLLLQNEAAHDGFKSAAYTVEYTVDRNITDPKEWYSIAGTDTIIFSGKHRWNLDQWMRSNPDGEIVKDFAAAVVNDSFMGTIMNRVPLYVYLHDSPDQLNSSNPMKHAYIQHDPLAYLFGAGPTQSLREYVAAEPITALAEQIAGSDGLHRFQITVYNSAYMNDASMPESIFVMDPDRDFFITESTYFNKGGAAWVQRTYECAEFVDEDGEHVYFPTKFEELRYGMSSDSEATQDVTARDSAVISEIQLNHEVAPEQFELTALPGAEPYIDHMMAWDTNGFTFTAALRNGRVIPVEQAQIIRGMKSMVSEDKAPANHISPEAPTPSEANPISSSEEPSRERMPSVVQLIGITLAAVLILGAGIAAWRYRGLR